MAAQIIPSAADFSLRRTSASIAGTVCLAQRIADRLRGGDVLLLYGPLGAGKTRLVQEICLAWGMDEEVTSPSFTLVNSYRGRFVVHHLDFYRLGPVDDLDEVGVPEVLDQVDHGTAVLLAEWPERLVPYLPERLELLCLPTANRDGRTWHLRGFPELQDRWRDLLNFEEPAC